MQQPQLTTKYNEPTSQELLQLLVDAKKFTKDRLIKRAAELLAAGADPNYKGKTKHTIYFKGDREGIITEREHLVIDLAYHLGYPELIDLLTRAGADFTKITVGSESTTPEETKKSYRPHIEKQKLP